MLSLLDQQKFYGSTYWDTYPDDNIHAIILPKEGRSGIYIGNIYAATDTKLHLRYNIKCILTVQMKCSVKFQGSEQILFHKVIPIDIENCGDLFKAFYDSYMFIENGITYGNVLIHCQDCVTISPVFVIAYMLQKNGFTVERAWEIVKIQNPFAQVRHQYFQQLLIYEQSLNLDTYLGQPPKEGKHLRNVEIKELSRLEKIREREQKQKTFIDSVYNKYHIENNYQIDYEELKKRYPMSRNY
ncbi:unnamed protein product [Paramecium octaurelia]|uniref:protein-tyrosine-phosphatase n=1 Tax=Paramecium octaurelia TaxID=43137 RepID=A0A8S1UQH8_PAROT|nr:unnamed protein product [Paramecium octaurelia]